MRLASGARTRFSRRVFIWFYRLLFLPLALVALPRYALRMRRRGGYRADFATRFGCGLALPEKRAGARRIWIQAVSLGEMLAIEPLLRGLASDPRNEIFLTVTTSTGYALARERYAELVLRVAYFPVDFWPFSRRVWKQVRPDLAMCAETELWPEHLEQARRFNVPFVLVNGRLSDRSFARSKRLAWLTRGAWRRIAKVYACSDIDGRRFVELGLPGESVEVTGNLKVDLRVEPVLSAEERAQLKARLGLGAGFVLLGSSTWPGEEAALLEAFRALRTRRADARLLIVPRHGERRGELEAWLREAAGGLRFHFKSRGLPESPVDIHIADTHGELRTLSQLADLAFIGKSLPPHAEGQTPVECGALGVPMILGPGMTNFRSIRDGLRAAGAIVEVADASELREAVARLADDPARRAAMGLAGKAWHRLNQGALERTLAGIAGWLDREVGLQSDPSGEGRAGSD